MATLEKIRSKSVALFIVIIVALLAFILGDLLNSGRSYFGSGTTMMSAGSRKIDYQEYQKQIDNLGLQGQDADEQRQALMQQMLLNDLMLEQYDLLGIKVSDKTLSEVMINRMPVTQQLGQAAQYLGLPAVDRASILDAINNPARYGLDAEQAKALGAVWTEEEAQVEQAFQNQAFMNLLSGLFAANEIDAKAVYDNTMAQTNMQYVSVPVSSVADTDVEVSDADLKAKWNEMKPAFNIDVFMDNYTRPIYDQQGRDTRSVAINEPMRAVDYVVVNIVPSAADFAAAREEVAKMTTALNAQSGLDALTGASGFTSETYSVTKDDIAKGREYTLKNLADSDFVAGKVVNFPISRATNAHNIAKVLDTKTAVDSVYATVFLMPATATDSIMGLIAAGDTLGGIVAANPGQGFANQWLRLEAGQYQPGTPLADVNVRKSLADATVGKVQLYTDSVNGYAMAYEVKQKKAPVTFYDIAVVTYTVDPSAQTISDLRSQLASFLASNNRGDLFSANADSLYMLQHAIVGASTPHIGNVAGTRPAVKWAMENKPGKVSPIFDSPSEYVVVAVKEAFEDFIPYNSAIIKDQIAAAALKDKKASKLIEQYAGKGNDLQAYAAAMNAEVRTDSAIVFQSARLANHFGDNSMLLGQLAAATPGQLVGPFQNDNEVIVLVAGETSSANRRPYDFQNDGGSFVREFFMANDGRRTMPPSVLGLFLGDRKVKNNSLKFERGIEE